MPRSGAKRDFFYICIFTQMCCFYSYVLTHMHPKHVQSMSLSIGNYSFLLGKSSQVTQVPTQNGTSPPSTQGVKLYSFLSYILSFFLSLRFLSLCSPILINVLVRFSPVIPFSAVLWYQCTILPLL